MQPSETATTDLSLLLGLHHDQIERILACGSESRFDGGTFIFREGDRADQFLIIQRGIVALEVFAPGRGSHTISTLHAGDLLGWSWLFPPYRWHFDARALESTAALAFDGACLRELCEADHDIGYRLVWRFAEVITQRLQAARLQLLDVYKSEGG